VGVPEEIEKKEHCRKKLPIPSGFKNKIAKEGKKRGGGGRGATGLARSWEHMFGQTSFVGRPKNDKWELRSGKKMDVASVQDESGRGQDRNHY